MILTHTAHQAQFNQVSPSSSTQQLVCKHRMIFVLQAHTNQASHDLEDWFTAFTQLGIKILKDGASGNAIGAFWVPNSLDPKNQTRSYARLYYEASKERPNYHILTGTTVTKLVLSGTTVTGVEVSNHPIFTPQIQVRECSFFLPSPTVRQWQRAPCHQSIRQKGSYFGRWNWPHASALATGWNRSQATFARAWN